MLGLIRRLETTPPPLPDRDAQDVRERALEALSAMAGDGGESLGIPEATLGPQLALRLANLMLHRHRRPEDARQLSEAVRSVFASATTTAARLAARDLAGRNKALDAAGGGGSLAGAGTEAGPTRVQLGLAVTSGLFLLGATGYWGWSRRAGAAGLTVVEAETQREAQRALNLGLRLLQQDRVPEAIKYFEKVAALESTLREKSGYYLAVASLKRGDTRTVTRVLSSLDLSAMEPEETYALGTELEARGQLRQAHTVFEKLYVKDVSFRDVKDRLEALRGQLAQFSETEVGDLIASRIIAPHYRGIEQIGVGGMGFVFRAVDTQRGDLEVAIKVLSPFYANHEEVYKRFIREAKGIASLAHPNLIRIYDVHEANLPYYSMEFLASRALKDLLAERGRLDPRTVRKIAQGFCQGLSRAHAMGIVHRDVKPANILVDDRLQVKVIDFGVAKFGEATSMTVTGQVLGTPRYMSPEQIKGLEIDTRSDIYSFGVVLYELLAGTTPFETQTDHVMSPVPPFPPEAAVPAPLAAVVTRCLAKSPEARYATLAELQAALEAAIPAPA